MHYKYTYIRGDFLTFMGIFKKRKEKKENEELREQVNILQEKIKRIESPFMQECKDIPKDLVNDFLNLHNLVDRKLESFILNILKISGYYAEKTSKFDNGSDIIANKDDVSYFIQIKGKKIKNNLIDKNDFIKEEQVLKYTHKLPESGNKVFITNSYYTENAKKFLLENKFEVIDLEKLYQLIAQVLPELIAAAYMSVDGLEKCPECHKHKCLCHHNGDFYGCVNYPQCHYTENKKNKTSYF